MQLINSKEKFGLMTKLLHWGIFGLFCAQYFLVYRRTYFPKDSPESTQYILLHKSFGVLILGLALFFILWRTLGSRPRWPTTMQFWQKVLSKVVHYALFFAMFAMPISGILMSQYHGYPVSWFGHKLPTLVSENKDLSTFFHSAHVIMSYAIIGLVGLHILGALTHHFYYKDRVLKNML
jgi:cytochrome b561